MASERLAYSSQQNHALKKRFDKAWFCWEEHMRRSRLDRSGEMAAAAATGCHERTRREHEGSGRPFWDFWGTSTEAA